MSLKISRGRPNDPLTPDASAAPLLAVSYAIGTKRKSRRMRKIKRVGWNLLPPLTFIIIVALWAAAVPIFKIPAYLLPGPGSVFSRVVTDAPMLWNHSVVTLTEILLGFGLTVLTAIPLGLVIALSPLAKQIGYPPLMLMQLVPKQVAPLFLVWLGLGSNPRFC